MNSPSPLVVSNESKWSNSVWGAASLTVAVVVSLANGSQMLPMPLGGSAVLALTIVLTGLGVALIALDVTTNRRQTCLTQAPAPTRSRASFAKPATTLPRSRANITVPTEAVVTAPVESEPLAEELYEEAMPDEQVKLPAKFTRGSPARGFTPNGSSKSGACHVVLSSAQYHFRKGDVQDKN